MKAGIKSSTLISSVILAIMSSLCCLVPVLAIIGGTTGAASSLSWLSPFRPYLIGATVLALGFAFYQAYKPTVTDSCGCVVTKKSFVQSKTFLWIVTCLSVLLLAFPYYSQIFFKQVQPKAVSLSSPNDTTVSFRVIGMTCEACEEHVDAALLNERGVNKITTNYEDSLTTVTYDRSKISLATLMQKVTEKTDYKTQPK